MSHLPWEFRMSSTEASYSYTTKIAGDLFTVRGDSIAEFKNNMDSAVFEAQFLVDAVGAIQAVGHLIPIATPLPVAAPAPAPAAAFPPPANFNPAPAPVWAAPPAAAPAGKQCVHGERQFRSGVSASTGKPWSAHFCPTPKGTPDQCAPEFIR